MKANYIVYVDGWKYDWAFRLDEAIQKAQSAAKFNVKAKEIQLYEVATKKVLHRWNKIG